MRDTCTQGKKSTKITLDGNVLDIGKDSCQQIVVFATTDGLKQLAKTFTWFMDGCFDIAPKLFLQRYVIRVPLGQSTISTVYELCMCMF